MLKKWERDQNEQILKKQAAVHGLQQIRGEIIIGDQEVGAPAEYRERVDRFHEYVETRQSDLFAVVDKKKAQYQS